MEKVISQPVTINHGDLLEICQSAEAWASTLRNRAHGNIPVEDKVRYENAADRIDKAIADARRAAFGNIPSQEIFKGLP
jgi:hypothetical protein